MLNPPLKLLLRQANQTSRKNRNRKILGIGIRKKRIPEYLCISMSTKNCDVRISKIMPFNYRFGCLMVGAT